MLEKSTLEKILAPAQPLLEESAQWITLSPPPDNTKIVTATEYLQPETLLTNIAAIAAFRKTDDLRVAASFNG